MTQKPATKDDEPTVKSTTPKAAAPAAKAIPKAPTGRANINTDEYWDHFFATTKFETADDAEKFLFRVVSDFIKPKKFDSAEIVLKRFLLYHDKEAEPWMYVFLAECIKARNGTDDDLKQTLSYAAYLAKRSKKPEDLIRVADIMVIRKFYGGIGEGKFRTNIGELIDMASDLVPTNAWPIMMSVNLATHDKDPKRMTDAAERLLAIGWPGHDDEVRHDLKEQVKNLADTLKIEGRNPESDALMEHLAESESRDIYIKLTWKGEADIDMSVAEPLGATANFQNFRTVFGGAIIKNGYGKHPEEVYVAPRAFDGDYVVTVEKIVDYDEKKPVLEADLVVILHEGSASEQRMPYKINLSKPEPIIFTLPKDTGRRKKILPYIAPPRLPVVMPRPKAKDVAEKPIDSPKPTVGTPR